jgi:hypothetical protein
MSQTKEMIGLLRADANNSALQAVVLVFARFVACLMIAACTTQLLLTTLMKTLCGIKHKFTHHKLAEQGVAPNFSIITSSSEYLKA